MIGLGIITYNPDIKIVKKNLDIYNKKEIKIVIVDNSSNNIAEIMSLITNYKNVSIIKNEENKGVANALNQIMLHFQELDFKWVLTFDQDSLIPDNVLDLMIDYIDLNNIGILAPHINYGFNFEEKKHYNNIIDEVDWCITSGSMVNINAWSDVGGFDESFFIDFVDTDFCYRIKNKKYKICKINNIELKHQLGNLKIYNVFGKKIKVMNHNKMRKYYYSRNSIICHKKNKTYYKSKQMIKDISLILIKTIGFEKNKIEKTIYIIHGIIDGIKYKEKDVC